MSEKETVKKIAVSETTFSQMSEELIEHLRKEENVQLIVVEDCLIHEHKMLADEKIDVVILSKDEEKELEAQKRIIEYKMSENIEALIDSLPEIIHDEPVRSRHKKNFYVPRTIGKPNPKKRGGR